ncbi:TPA: hypothetical protein DCZ15_01410 [Candidatus Falkowbacteria bacterium]|nr:MAG: hypothetical protein UV95_C0003G0144 [Candidatus Falkowbacteria bacterium GW2011_GWF2_43_32]HBA36513.1 hypothetical protein [Candidatus Falkowbacteria bacterium]
MEEKIIILPLDGYVSASRLLAQLENVMKRREVADLVAYIKVNDGLHNPDAGGPEIGHLLAEACERYGIKLFLDMKIFDVSATLINVLKKYQETTIGILTVSSQCSLDGIIALRQLLPNTKLAMVSAGTDMSDEECSFRFGMTPAVKIYNDLANINCLCAQQDLNKNLLTGPFDLVVCSPRELSFLCRNVPEQIGFVVPGIRDAWMLKTNKHQKRIAGVREAVDWGATFVVMGAQLTKGNPDEGISPEESCRRTAKEIRSSRRYCFAGNKPLAVLKACGGYYHSPQDNDGNYIGPLVAYAGTYPTEGGSKNYVGFEYFNFARAEDGVMSRSYFAQLIINKLEGLGIIGDVVMGAPMGGILLAGEVGRKWNRRTIFAEKKIIALADQEKGRKEESRLIVDRHEIGFRETVIIVEDVCNNFSTTAYLKDLIEARGAVLTAIVCAFNRSGQNDWKGIPVISAHFIPTKQYRQDDPEVSALVKEGKVVWKPKNDWAQLTRIMGV